MGAYPSWSQVVGELPGCGVIVSSGGMTASSTTAAGMPGYLPPPPGLPLIDFSKWRLLLPEVPASGGPTAPTNPPWSWEVHPIEGHGKENHGGALSRQTGPADSSAIHINTVHTPDGAVCLATAPGVASYGLPASGTTTTEVHGEGSWS